MGFIVSIIVSIIVYFIGLWLGNRLLKANNIELPRFSRWLIINTFAIALSYLFTLPF